uniref:OSJNBb0006N15.5 protein n=1 Tax=Oryza sativa subsp. japonica TaxID=39947 RepID=Q7XMJ4_ORYSJ|nr:OSJNBb0006N15.5 [Oryza sativa Japonica Group]
MHSKGIKFMSPLTIDSEERAGEKWPISKFIKNKTLSQPENFISYQDSKGNVSIRFTNYETRASDDLDTESSDRNIIDNRRHSISELMEKLDYESEIKYYEDKLRDIADEYNNSMKSEWPKIRDKELYFYRELSRIKKQKKEKSLAIETPRTQEIKIEQIKLEENQKFDKVLSEEEQWEVNERLLLESYEEENNLIEEIENIEEEDNAEQYNDFIDSLDEVGLHNLDNAMEAMEVDLGTGKRKRYGDGFVKNEGERERPARAAGRWPPEKEEYSYNYIPGQYRHMGTKRRDFEKPIKFQNQKSDGAILNLAAHDPIDWPNIISIWKGLIVQKYIQNQHNIGNKVEDMITNLETFLGESAKVLWEQWVEKNPNNYEELKRAGSNPHNFANIVSNIIIAEDLELGYTTLQNERLKEIEKLTLTSWKGIKEFSQHYLYNATTAKQGYNKGIVERYFNKLPDPLGSMIFEEYKKETEGAEINISQAITFVFKQLRKICTGIQAQRSMKHSDYNFCNKKIQIPLSYGEERPRNKRNHRYQRRNNNNIKTKNRYFLRRSDNIAPFLHKRNVRRYNPKKTYDKTCRCFICNSPDHLSRTCANKDQKRYSSKYEEQERVLIIDSVNENILVCDDEIKDDESIYSIIETDEIENTNEEYESTDEELDLIDELAGLKIEMMDQLNCEHDWIRGK